MEDLATDRIYRLMIAQRIRHRDYTPESISRMFDDELERILTELPADAGEPVMERYRTARQISEFLIRNQEFDPI
jgi:malate synthase